ncbi:MAG: HlyD family efflux transporter periplasmic adaptor subunit [Acidobacteria bacterium]|nr:HlyD family efflux transporter periplasmic adaptor subunit [Acidobacteriota bacterium]
MPTVSKPVSFALGESLLFSRILPALFLLALIAVIGWRAFPSSYTSSFTTLRQALAATGEPPAVALHTALIESGEISKQLRLDGELRAVRSRTIFAEMTDEAKITWMPEEGTQVKAGDRLIELDSTAVLTKIKDAEEKLIAAENEILRVTAQQEGQLRDFQVELSRHWLAFEKAKVEARLPADVVSRREYQEKQFALDKARTEYETQQAKIEQKKREFAAELLVKTIEKQKTEGQLAQAKQGLNRMLVKAPTEGMVLYSDHWNERRKMQVGDVVWGGLPLLTLPILSEMELVAQVNEVDGPKISVGNKARIVLDSAPQEAINGTVTDVSQTAAKASWQAKAKVFTVIISLEKTLIEMKPGMSAQVSIVVGNSGSQLLVPRAALHFGSETPMVTRLESANQQRPVAVTITAADAKHYAVAANGALKAGDKVVLP